MPPFTFDFTNKKPNIDYVPEQEQSVARIRKDTGNICPYLKTPRRILKTSMERLEKHLLIFCNITVS